MHELIERFDAHLKAEKYYSVIANMRGESPETVATLLMNADGLQGLQGPTISSVYHMEGNGTAAQHGFYAATICVSKKNLYKAVKSLQKVRGGRDLGDMYWTEENHSIPWIWPDLSLYSVSTCPQLGGSGVLVQPMTYIFDEEPKR